MATATLPGSFAASGTSGLEAHLYRGGDGGVIFPLIGEAVSIKEYVAYVTDLKDKYREVGSILS